jgi:hypothetical protein
MQLASAALGKLLPYPKEYGSLLGRSVFPPAGPVRQALREARAALKDSERLHVLLFVEAEDLWDVRWERLCAPLGDGQADDWQFLTLNHLSPFSLYLPAAIDRRFPPIVQRDLRALVVVANPFDLDLYKLKTFKAEEALTTVKHALEPIPHDVLARLPGTAGFPTLDAVVTRLSADHYPLLHVVCHGRYFTNSDPPEAGAEAKGGDASGRVRPSGETVLYLEKEDGKADPVEASRLLERLRPLHGGKAGLPRLTFLAACETAVPEEQKRMGGLAQRLVRELGLPSVLAMTEPVEIDLAKRLTGSFYPSLRDHGWVDLALAQACAGLAEQAGAHVPVLYSRLAGQALFGGARAVPTDDHVRKALVEGKQHLQERAPVLVDEWVAQAEALRVDPDSLSPQARQKWETDNHTARVRLSQICEEALDVRFDALANGSPLPRYDGRCPFRGLLPFGPGQAQFFFGRGPLIKRMAELLRRRDFLAVLGGSGCGKSSLVLAGLLPHLHANRKFEPAPSAPAGQAEPELEQLRRQLAAWQVAYLRPGADPRGNLALALKECKDGAKHLVVDQLEELFTQGKEEQRAAFLDELLRLRKQLDVKVIVTLRADFWGDCARFALLRRLMERRQVLIGPLTATGLRRALERQAETVGLRFEADLAETILDDVRGEPGAMPLLQHALLKVWERRHGRWLRAEEYRAIGGIQQAIGQTADEYYDKQSPARQVLIRDVFLRLIRVGEATGPAGERRDVRQRVRLEDLQAAGTSPEAVREIVNDLAGARLLVTDRDPRSDAYLVELAHEALIRSWDRLRRWLDDYQVGLRQRAVIGLAALEWDTNARDDSYLAHQGRRLRNARALCERYHLPLSDLETAYVTACEARSGSRWATPEAELRVGPEEVLFSLPQLGREWITRLTLRQIIGGTTDGHELGTAVFTGEVGEAMLRFLSAMRERKERWSLRLRLDWGRSLPWEQLYFPFPEGWRPLAEELSLWRFTPGHSWGWRQPAPVLERPIRVLAVFASPPNLGRFGLLDIPVSDRQRVRELLSQLPDVSVRYLESGTDQPPTVEQLARALDDEPHIVHLLAHSRIARTGMEEVAVFLESAKGDAVPVSSLSLTQIFRRLSRPPMLGMLVPGLDPTWAERGGNGLTQLANVLVAECEFQTAVAFERAPPAERAAPADTIRRFIDAFYGRLFERGIVDRAMDETRGKLKVELGDGVPVLISQRTDTRIFDL